MDRRLLGLPARRRRRRADRLSLVARLSRARRRIVDAQARARRPGRAAARATAAARRSGACTSSTGPTARRPPVGHRTRRRRGNHLHVRRDRRAEGRRHHPPQRAGEHRAGRARGAEVPQVGRRRSSRSGSSTCCRSATCSARRWRRSFRRCCRASSSSCAATTRARSSTQIKKRRVSVLVSVPKILDVLREHVAARRASRQRATPSAPTGRHGDPHREALVAVSPDPSPVRAEVLGFVVGAAPLDAELEAFWGELGFAVIQGYGLTETAPIVTLNHPFGTKRGSVGKPIAGVEMKIARGRRDSRARRERHDRILQRRRGDRARVRGRLVPHRRHRRDRAPTASCSSAAARRK